MTAQSIRVLASVARRGAAVIREAAYVEAVVQALERGPLDARALELFTARHRFTPGWSSRSLSFRRMADELGLPVAPQDGPQAAPFYQAAIGADPYRPGR